MKGKKTEQKIKKLQSALDNIWMLMILLAITMIIIALAFRGLNSNINVIGNITEENKEKINSFHTECFEWGQIEHEELIEISINRTCQDRHYDICNNQCENIYESFCFGNSCHTNYRECKKRM